MLISTLKKTLLKPARPARRRFRVETISLQDLEPRLFLSVNSLLAADTTASDAEDTADVDIDSSSLDSAQLDAMASVQVDAVDASVDVGATESSSDSGSVTSPVAWTENPSLSNFFLGTSQMGVYAAGSVEWPDSPYGLGGLPVFFYKTTGALEGVVLTETDGSFHLTHTNEYTLTAKLMKPYTGEIVDTWTAIY